MGIREKERGGNDHHRARESIALFFSVEEIIAKLLKVQHPLSLGGGGKGVLEVGVFRPPHGDDAHGVCVFVWRAVTRTDLTPRGAQSNRT